MKLKRILTILGCFALILMCSLTVVGCGEVEATKDEVNEFLQADGIETSFEDKGYHFDLYSRFGDAEVFKNGYVKMSGEIVPVDEDIEARMYVEYYYEETATGTICAFSGTYYLKDDKFYSTKTKNITSNPSDIMTSSLYDSVVSAAKGVSGAINEIISYESDTNTTLTYQKKGDLEKKNVEFTITAKNSILKKTAFVKFNNGKIVEFLSDTDGEGASIKISIKEYNGQINFPSFDDYEDKTIPPQNATLMPNQSLITLPNP